MYGNKNCEKHHLKTYTVKFQRVSTSFAKLNHVQPRKPAQDVNIGA
jgi:hypothetical protein